MAALLARLTWPGPGNGPYDMHQGMRLGFVEMIIVLFFFLIPVAIVVGIVVLILRSNRSTPAPTTTSPQSDARSILDARYARGEIDTAEYEERRRALG